VNVEQIKELQPMFRGEHVVVLHNGKTLPLTRGVRELQELLTRS
jgi:DNA-binding LytR/AlgR family response regulator